MNSKAKLALTGLTALLSACGGFQHYKETDCKLNGRTVTWNGFTEMTGKLYARVGVFKNGKEIGRIAVADEKVSESTLSEISTAFCTTGDFAKAQKVAAKMILGVSGETIKSAPLPIKRP